LVPAQKKLPAERPPHAQDKMPGPALSPAEALKKMKAPEGFSVELVASEPDLVNPVAMTFDEKGRIWVTESLEYPRRSAGPVARAGGGEALPDRADPARRGAGDGAGGDGGAGGAGAAGAVAVAEPAALAVRDLSGTVSTKVVSRVLTGRYSVREKKPKRLTGSVAVVVLQGIDM
jgi:hypothetical protein